MLTNVMGFMQSIKESLAQDVEFLARPLSLRSWSLQSWVCFLLTLTLFALPLSSTAKSIGIGLVVSLIGLSKAYRPALSNIIRKPWCQASFFIVLLAFFACLWSPASLHEKITILEKYTKLLYLPILAVGFHDPRARRAGLHAFLFAMVMTCLISMGKFYNLMQYGNGPDAADAGAVFRNHVMTSHLMVFATYLASVYCLRHTGKVRLFYAALVILLSYQVLFINTARTGYVMYAVLMLLFLIQTFSWQKALRALVCGSLLLTAAIYISPVIQQKIHESVSEWQQYRQHEPDNPIGYRLQFHSFAVDLFKRHPWLGNGTGSFTYYFRIENPVKVWTRTLLEPHSQYWMVIAEWGRIGFLALIAFFVSLFVASWQLKQMRNIAMALLISFMIGNLSDSLLFYSGTGYLFILLMALCLGESPDA